LPSPSPLEAPRTRPAISTNSKVVGTCQHVGTKASASERARARNWVGRAGCWEGGYDNAAAHHVLSTMQAGR
jgi:hypothetical protein